MNRISNFKLQIAKHLVRVCCIIAAIGLSLVNDAFAQAPKRGGRAGRAAPQAEKFDFAERQAVDRIAAEIRDALTLRKTLVVWIVEQSTEAGSLPQRTADEIGRVMPDLLSAADGRLEVAIVGFANESNLITPDPIASAERLQQAILELTVAKGDKAAALAALKQAVDKFLPYRYRGYEVIFVIAGASCSDEARLADTSIVALKRAATPVYGIGPAVPFVGRASSNRAAQRPTTVLSSSDRPRSAESLFPERIQLSLAGNQSAADLDDSGYGPFALERVCRLTGGKFYRLHDNSPAGWQVDGSSGDIKADLIAKYAPDYINEVQHQKLLASNKCRLALHNASLLPATAGLESARTDFPKARDEATLARDIKTAQEAAAVRDQPIQRLYDALIAGESDRPNLTGARWQAGYDLAMGQILAAKARLDGYNAMLATLKQGKSFENADSKRWVLEPADELAASTALDKMAKNSRVYLQRVIAEHPGTPWASIAERELRYPAGWKWVEK